MANMEHTRFENTFKDFMDCLDALQSGEGLEGLSRSEWDYAEQLCIRCEDYINAYNELAKRTEAARTQDEPPKAVEPDNTFTEGCGECGEENEFEYREGQLLYACKRCGEETFPCNICDRLNDDEDMGCRDCTRENPRFKLHRDCNFRKEG